jgi:cell wall-associated NlpC family hydrolase
VKAVVAALAAIALLLLALPLLAITILSTSAGACPSAGIPGIPTSAGAINNPTDFADALLISLGAPTSPANVSSVVAWEAREGGNWHNSATNNPLNTTLPEPGSLPMNSVGVQAYVDWPQGIKATVDTLLNGRYSDIVGALQAGMGLATASYPGLLVWSGGAYDRIGGAGGTVAVPVISPGASCAAPAGSGRWATVFAFLQSKIGLPYQWGGTGPLYDCSGLVQAAYAAAGVALPRTSQQQYAFTLAKAIPYDANTPPGALLFFDAVPPTHVGVYVGGGMMIDSPNTGSFVREEPVWSTLIGAALP